ncbi:MAG: chemotaxis protein CheW [Candidatus Obscuribacterales bacterium]|nr:chemotaxis protein CheW [Candidatus Obscuribacterales bacterium]
MSEVLGGHLRRSILKRRAAQLARPIDKPEIPPGSQYVLFEIAKQRFACEIRYTDEVFQLKSVLPIPGTPPYILGIISLRGLLTTVVDLRHLFNLYETSVLTSDRCIIAKHNDFQVALLTDDVLGLEFIADDDIQDGSSIMANIPRQYIHGITINSTIIIDCTALLNVESLEVNQ